MSKKPFYNVGHCRRTDDSFNPGNNSLCQELGFVDSVLLFMGRELDSCRADSFLHLVGRSRFCCLDIQVKMCRPHCRDKVEELLIPCLEFGIELD